MLSTCPNCLNQINHQDEITEVKCPDCGTSFAAYLKVNLEEHTDEVSSPGDSPSFDPAPILSDLTLPQDAGLPAEPTSMAAPDFNESTNAFAEIRDFGETMQDHKPAPLPPLSPPPGANEAQPVPTPVIQDGTEWLMTSGDLLQGHAIVEYLSPISVLCELVPGDNPMRPAFTGLRAQATRLGANAVVAMRWSLSGDASKVLVSGTAVKCAKS